MVTTLRVSGAPEACRVNDDPQDAQNCDSAAFAKPHVEQIELPGAYLIKPCPSNSRGGASLHLDKPKLVLHTRHMIEGEEMPAELPEHVKKYLSESGVSEDKLSPEALAMYASLSGGEIALLREIGKSLEKVDIESARRIH
jgi:hypothetical protein